MSIDQHLHKFDRSITTSLAKWKRENLHIGELGFRDSDLRLVLFTEKSALMTMLQKKPSKVQERLERTAAADAAITAWNCHSCCRSVLSSLSQSSESLNYVPEFEIWECTYHCCFYSRLMLISKVTRRPTSAWPSRHKNWEGATHRIKRRPDL